MALKKRTFSDLKSKFSKKANFKPERFFDLGKAFLDATGLPGPAMGHLQMTSEERMKQYLSIMLPKGTKQGEKRIRIVPTTDGSSPFKEVFFHNVQVQGRWQKLYDPCRS